MAYSSDINLKIGEVPKTTDPEMLPDFIEIYNALHILAQWVDAVHKAHGSGDINTPPWEAMPFRDYFYTPAAQEITSGNVVTMIDYEFFSNDKGNTHYSLNGVINGAASWGLAAAAQVFPDYQGYPRNGGITGMSMSDALPGELVKVGVGPAIIRMEGVRTGEPVYAYPAYSSPVNNNVIPQRNRRNYATIIGKGGLIKLPREGGMFRFEAPPILVGRGVAPDALMFTPPSLSFADSNLYFTQEPPPPQQDTGGA